MRISDWSSYVCSSDLVCHFNHAHRAKAVKRRPHGEAIGAEHADLAIVPGAYIRGQKKGPGHMIHIIAGRAVKHELFQPGFALDRKSVVYGMRVTVRVDLGGRRTIKKNSITE